jgi:hypothetical protein
MPRIAWFGLLCLGFVGSCDDGASEPQGGDSGAQGDAAIDDASQNTRDAMAADAAMLACAAREGGAASPDDNDGGRAEERVEVPRPNAIHVNRRHRRIGRSSPTLHARPTPSRCWERPSSRAARRSSARAIGTSSPFMSMKASCARRPKKAEATSMAVLPCRQPPYAACAASVRWSRSSRTRKARCSTGHAKRARSPQHDGAGLRIAPRTPVPRWMGERMDYNEAVGALQDRARSM